MKKILIVTLLSFSFSAYYYADGEAIYWQDDIDANQP